MNMAWCFRSKQNVHMENRRGVYSQIQDIRVHFQESMTQTSELPCCKSLTGSPAKRCGKVLDIQNYHVWWLWIHKYCEQEDWHVWHGPKCVAKSPPELLASHSNTGREKTLHADRLSCKYALSILKCLDNVCGHVPVQRIGQRICWDYWLWNGRVQKRSSAASFSRGTSCDVANST